MRYGRNPPCAFAALSFGARFTLWSVRCWTEAARYGVWLHPILREAFSRARAEDAYLALNQVLFVAARGARRSTIIHPRTGPLVGADELLLLGIIADLQADRTQTAQGKIGEWMTPWGVREAIPALRTFAEQLLEAGISVPGRTPSRRSSVFRRQARIIDPAGCSLH